RHRRARETTRVHRARRRARVRVAADCERMVDADGGGADGGDGGDRRGRPGADLATVRRYIRQAERVGADAIISLPPAELADHQAIVAYYQEIGAASKLPLFVQAVGNVDVGLLLELYRTIPTMRFVKDEAGDPLQRVGPLREQSHDEIKVFSGGHGRKLIDEMERGFSGSMPAASFADLYAT